MRRTFITMTVILAALTLSAGAARGVAAWEKPPKARCQTVKGHITDQPFAGAECASPLGQCSAGRFYGVLKGNFIAAATSYTPTRDTTTTCFFCYSDDRVLHTKEGDLSLKDAGAFNTTPGSRGEHATVTTVTGGTGRWAGATGRLMETGTFTQEDGGYSDYEGEICTP